MIASGEYADIMNLSNWSTGYNGGTSGAYKDGVIIDLTPYYESGKMPNYRRAIEADPEHIKKIKSVEGKIFTASIVRDSAEMNSSFGPQVRKDWLDKLGLSIPDTIGDWYNMLVAFKTQDPNGNGKADEIPFADSTTQAMNHFVYAFDNSETFYPKDGKIVYGPVQPEYKEYLAEMSKWYAEGLIDPEFAALARANMNAKVTNDIVGAYVGYVSSNMSSYLTAMDDHPTFDLVGVPWPRRDENSVRYIARDLTGLVGGAGGAVVSTVCKDPDTAVKVLDYFYSEEATDLLNWGVEGETYTKEKGEYQFTDLIRNNPEGKAPAEALGKYCWPGLGVPGKLWLNEAYSKLQYVYPQQVAATKVWTEGDTTMVGADFKFLAEESERKSSIMADTDPYQAEITTKIIIGKEPLSKFDEYVENMYKYGLGELTEIYQKAYERYESLK